MLNVTPESGLRNLLSLKCLESLPNTLLIHCKSCPESPHVALLIIFLSMKYHHYFIFPVLVIFKTAKILRSKDFKKKTTKKHCIIQKCITSILNSLEALIFHYLSTKKSILLNPMGFSINADTYNLPSNFLGN